MAMFNDPLVTGGIGAGVAAIVASIVRSLEIRRRFSNNGNHNNVHIIEAKIDTLIAIQHEYTNLQAEGAKILAINTEIVRATSARIETSMAQMASAVASIATSIAIMLDRSAN